MFKFIYRHKLAIIWLIGLLAYVSILGHSFVWDDEEQLVNNYVVQSPRFIADSFLGSTFNSGGGLKTTGYYYKPLMTVSWGLGHAIWGLNAWGFHAFQLLLHLLNVSLVFLLLAGLFEQYFEKNRAEVLAFWAALIFSLHPINVEAVSYISATQDVLYAFFSLLVLAAIIRPPSFVNNSFRQSTILGILVLGGLLSKEAAIIVLPLGLIMAALFARKRLLDFFMGSTLAVAVYLLLRLSLAGVGFSFGGIMPIMQASLGQRLLTLPQEVFYYLVNYLFPFNLAISQHWVITRASLTGFWLPLVIILAVAGGIFWLGRRLKNRLFWFFMLWLILSLGLVLNIVPLDMTVASRWFYLPQIGLLGMLFTVVGGAGGISREARLPLFLIILVYLGSLTIARTFIWKDSLTLFGTDIKRNPQAFDLQNNYGVALFREGEIEQAKPHFEKSIELKADWWTNYNNLGVCYQRQGDLKQAEKLYRQSINQGQYYLAYENLASVLLGQKKYAEAVKFLEESQNVLPLNVNLIANLAAAYYNNGQKDKALEAARYLTQVYPSYGSQLILQKIMNNEKLEF